MLALYRLKVVFLRKVFNPPVGPGILNSSTTTVFAGVGPRHECTYTLARLQPLHCLISHYLFVN